MATCHFYVAFGVPAQSLLLAVAGALTPEPDPQPLVIHLKLHYLVVRLHTE